MRKIAFVIGGLPFGGVENWLFDIALRMKRGGAHACRIFNVSGTGVKMSEFEVAGIDVVCIGNSNAAASTHRLDTALRLRRELKRYDPDIIHPLHFRGDYFERIAAIGLGVPVITIVVWAMSALKSRPWHPFFSSRCCLAVRKNTSISQRLP